MIAIPARERRTLVLGASVLALGLLLGKGIPAALRWSRETREAADARAGQVARARAETRLLAEMRDSAAARRTRIVALAPRILEGRTAPAAGATLAALVAGAAARAEVQLGTVEVRFDSAATGYFVPVRVRADATGGLPGLLRMMSILEEGDEILRVPEWSLAQQNPGGPAEQPEAIHLELVVEGLAAPEAETPEEEP